LDKLEARLAPATLPTGFTEFAITGTNIISSATAMEIAPDGKLFVLEQAGTIEVYQGSGATAWTRLQANFLANVPISVDSFFERGMLGIAFDPNYASNRYVYLYYTTSVAPVHNRIVRVTANANGDLALAGSLVSVVELDNLSAGNHNGGAIHFGPDGMLYAAVGDNAVGSNAQSLANRHGKILRYDVSNLPNVIPADNPTTIAGLGTPAGANRAIWAAGLRNPYTFAFKPGTSTMYINDVGQNSWEEVNVGAAGANYGWNNTEGPFNQATFPNFTHPVVYYNHTNGSLSRPALSGFTGRAITGGAFYTPGTYTFPVQYVDDYFFADYVSDWIKVFDPVANTVANFASGALGAVDLKVAADGSLLYLSRDAAGGASGRVFRVQFTGSAAPYIVVPPTNQSVGEGNPVTFSVQAGGPGTLTYQWQRNAVDIPGATAATYTINSASLADNGAAFRVVVTNASGNVTSSAATLTVNANQPPVPTILTPTAGTTFSYGDAFTYSGSATDPEDGTLGGAAFTWWVTYHTGGVERPFVPETSGSTTGGFTLPTISPYTEPDVFYRVHLRVEDSLGATAVTTRDIQPNLVQVTLTSNPVGAGLQLDGLTYASPHVFTAVPGLQRTLGAPAVATIGGLAYDFVNWAHGGAINQTIAAPALNTTYTANYSQRPPRVAEFRVDNGTAQRSSVRSLRLTYDAILSYAGTPGAAYSLTGGPGGVNLVVGAIDNSSGRSVVTLNFSGPGLVGGSLPNGLYSLTVFGDQLSDSLGADLDGDANGTPGGDFVGDFHRLFGDADGDRDVDAADFLAMRLAFGTNEVDFDFDGDGDTDATDFAAFRSAFGTSI
jgi:glucose/arabinose dehydrogenase